jgi:hypothetical protein
MKPRTEEEIAALKALVGFLLKQVKELTARAETLRALLVAHHVFDEAEYERLYAQSLSEFERAMNTGLLQAAKAMEAANAAAIQQLLETHEGPKQ